jgi:hypothetical protein
MGDNTGEHVLTSTRSSHIRESHHDHTTGRSFTKFPTSKDGAVSYPIEFAHRTAETSFLQSTFNRERGRYADLDPERGLRVSVHEPESAPTQGIDMAQEKQNNGRGVMIMIKKSE